MSMTWPRGCARDAGDSSTGAASVGLHLPAPTSTTTTAATTTATTSILRVPYQEPTSPPAAPVGVLPRWSEGVLTSREKGRKMLVSPLELVQTLPPHRIAEKRAATRSPQPARNSDISSELSGIDAIGPPRGISRRTRTERQPCARGIIRPDRDRDRDRRCSPSR